VSVFSKGSTKPTGGWTVRSLSISPIYINVNEKSDIEVQFTDDLGMVEVQIVNEYNVVVYTNNVDTSIDADLNINISNFLEGAYSITFKDAEGNIIHSEYFLAE